MAKYRGGKMCGIRRTQTSKENPLSTKGRRPRQGGGKRPVEGGHGQRAGRVKRKRFWEKSHKEGAKRGRPIKKAKAKEGAKSK